MYYVPVDTLLGAEVLHAAPNLAREPNQLLLRERGGLSVGALVAGGGPAGSQVVPQIAVLGKLNDDVQGTVLGT